MRSTGEQVQARAHLTCQGNLNLRHYLAWDCIEATARSDYQIARQLNAPLLLTNRNS